MDGALHDMTTSIDKESVGLTIHSSRLGNRAAEMRLRDHCRRRKYLHRANQWFGIALRPDGSIRLAAKLSSPPLGSLIRRLEAVVVRDSLKRTRTPVRSSRKVGRNQRCVLRKWKEVQALLQSIGCEPVGSERGSHTNRPATLPFGYESPSNS